MITPCLFVSQWLIIFPLSLQLKEFLLDQPEAYEIKIGDQAFRRPGDPPLEEVLEMLHKEKKPSRIPGENEGRSKEEL